MGLIVARREFDVLKKILAQEAKQRKIPGGVVLAVDKFSVNMRSYRKYTFYIVLSGFYSAFVFKFYIWLSRLSSKKFKIIQYDFLTGTRKKI